MAATLSGWVAALPQLNLPSAVLALSTVVILVVAKRLGSPLSEVQELFRSLPIDETPSQRDWRRVAAASSRTRAIAWATPAACSSAVAARLAQTVARRIPLPVPAAWSAAGGASATTNDSGARAQATSSPAACLQNGRVRAAKQVQRAVGRAPAGIVIVTR